MKRFASIFLITAIVLQSLSSLVIIMGYEVNQTFITQKFCVNKSKPALHCNGKCHLQMQLKEQEKKEQLPSSSTKEKLEIIHFFQDELAFSFIANDHLTEMNSLYSVSDYNQVIFPIFHPPSC